MKEKILQQLKALPGKPGVYLFKKDTEVLYVGKASSLYNRVSSYFNSPQNQPPKVQKMVAKVTDFDFFVTHSEQEALLLESNLIKKYRPRYNVRLKDDKSYPYLKISLGEDWPRVFITRRIDKDEARYFGPFASPGSVRRTLHLLKRLFPYRSCKKIIKEGESRPCLDYHIHRCLGPCIGAVSGEDYRQVIEQVILFLEGKQEIIVRQLRDKMDHASGKLEFEKAAVLRDQIEDIERVVEKQKIAAPEGEMDVVAMARNRDQTCMLVFNIRNGKLIGRESFILAGTQDEEQSRIMTSFLKQFYDSASYIPEQVLLQYQVEETDLIRKWLADKRKLRVDLKVPLRGEKKKLVDMVAENARQGLEQFRTKSLSEPETLIAAMKELKDKLCLPCLPRRVECYDISNIQGAFAVGSMVVFEEGLPKKSHYRRFRIKSVEGADDYAMLREVLRRRFRKGVGCSGENSWAIIPDFVIVDGGKGQLGAALEVMREIGVENIPCAGIAKEEEAIFRPGMTEPVIFPASSIALYFIQRMRDEAHRFALGYHHKIHRRESLASAIDAVPGIGAKRKQALLRQFGSVKGVKQATLEELTAVKGMTRSVADRVKKYL